MSLRHGLLTTPLDLGPAGGGARLTSVGASQQNLDRRRGRARPRPRCHNAFRGGRGEGRSPARPWKDVMANRDRYRPACGRSWLL